MKNLFLVAITALALAGCVSKYKSVAYEAPSSKLIPQASFYIMLPPDGQYDGKPYPSSGTATSRAVAAALAPHAAKVFQASAVEDFEHALGRAQQDGFKYLFQSTILNWEDRATEWSGIPDKIELKFTVYEVATAKSLASSVSKASSKWATLGGDHPQDLLPTPTESFVNSLF